MSHASHHARARMAERYGLELAPSDWRRLTEGIEQWPWERNGTTRVAHVPIVLDREILTVPIVYDRTHQGLAILTVLPGGVSRPR